jgi:hypothetical protein
LRRFSLACAQDSAAEAIIDFVIALEALFVPDAAGELSYQLRLNGARYLGETPEDRVRIFQLLKELYGLRSKLVHGNWVRIPSRELEDRLAHAREIVAKALIKALSHGWPTAGDFVKAALN